MTLTHVSITGLYTAIVTPFAGDMSVDHAALTRIVDLQITAGASGIVPIGGTGEYPALSRDERRAVVATCVEAARGRPVVPGVLSTGFADAVEAGRDFLAAGASALMLVTPYYAPGTPDGMRAYFRAYRDTVDLPILLYQIPRRTTVAVPAEGIQAMVEDGSIIGMKYSSYDMPDFIRVMRLVGDRMAVLSGEESLLAAHMRLGARGGVLATATVYPRIWIEIIERARSGDLDGALALQSRIDPLVDAVFKEMNPGPLKAFMQMVGMPVGSVRLPLLPPAAATLHDLERAAAHARSVSLA